jgi:hypothetical protein
VGWTHQQRLLRLAPVRELDDLRSITLLQGHGWSELDIFDSSGLRTYEAGSDDLFHLVDQQRVDLLPRGVSEIQWDQEVVDNFSKAVVIDPYLLLVYPFAGFYYVSPENNRLAAAINTGFKNIKSDGSYQKLLESLVYTRWLRDQLNLSKRKVIFIPNPQARGVLDVVDPSDWIVPWGRLADGEIKTGAQLCAFSGLKALCH